ncbi:hypothetical protein [Flaviaesturariibacter aridisoli]|uniref:Uncharacterized protein n=1 Tax=Flaviaesturariibacter aridisoli TaxID=2545761 RepID=A0A4R4E5Y3_9BACT|nr:hypothetical protein [Flaviaesturariibacter aridisoli]TCZ74889.1 hypothetical protein E0486_00870 [Flaviaesturariibacter aridisoli]
MNFDFYSQYKDWSDTDLRRVLQFPDDYQPDAVAAAEAVLSERNVLLYERVPAMPEPAAFGEAGEGESILESLLAPPERRFGWPPVAWMRAIYLGVGALVGWSVYQDGLSWYGVIASGGSVLSFPFLVSMSVVLLQVLGAFLGLRRNHWGWRITVAFQTLALSFALYSLYYFLFRYRYDSSGSLWFVGLFFSLRGALVIGLCRAPLMAYFGLRPAERWRAIGAGIALAGFFLVIFWLQ